MKYTHPILKPLFMAAARLPLIGPHDQEVELLRSGAKPVAMFGATAPEVNDLQKDVDAGNLIRVDVNERMFDRSYLLYAWPAVNIDDISTTCKEYIEATNPGEPAPEAISQKYRKLRNEYGLTEYEARRPPLGILGRRLYEASENILQHVPQWLERNLQLEHKLSTLFSNVNVREFLDGKRQGFFVRVIDSETILPLNLREQLDKRHSQGAIQCTTFDCSNNSDMVIFGHPGQEENMDDLAFILRQPWDYDLSKLESRGLTPGSLGKILGYSDDDVALWMGQYKMSRVTKTLLSYTNGMRRDIRFGVMKEMGPDWSRNP